MSWSQSLALLGICLAGPRFAAARDLADRMAGRLVALSLCLHLADDVLRRHRRRSRGRIARGARARLVGTRRQRPGNGDRWPPAGRRPRLRALAIQSHARHGTPHSRHHDRYRYPAGICRRTACTRCRECGHGVYEGPELAKLQKAAYPDLAPLTLALAPAMAFAQALATARSMPGWTIVPSDPCERPHRSQPDQPLVPLHRRRGHSVSPPMARAAVSTCARSAARAAATSASTPRASAPT